jgi:ATP-binding cassette subfamily B protein
LKDFIRVLSYAGKDKYLMRRAAVYLLFSVICSMIPFFLLGRIIARFTGDEPPTGQYILIMVGAVLVCLLLKNILNGLGLDASHKLAYRTLAGMRKRVAAKLLQMSMGDIQSYGTGNIKKNFVENIEDMELILAHAIPEGVANILSFALVYVVLFFIDWRMALLAFAALPPGLLPVILMMKDGMKRMAPYYQASQTMTNTIIEYICGMAVIKVFGQTTRSFKKYSDSITDYRNKTLDWYRASWNYMASFTVILPAALLFMLPFGTMLYMDGTLALDTFILTILLAMSAGLPAVRIISFLPSFPQLGYKSKKIESMFEQNDMSEGKAPPPVSHDLVFDNVSFAYNEQEVIKKVSFNAKANTITALVGESGAGKSTLAKLLVRFWDLKEGRITIGGTDIRELPFETLMDSVSYVSQDNFLFNTSIMENIRFGRPGASDEECVAMAKMAQCHEFILETERGYDTIVGGSGDKLSGGQRQRICIARAMLKNAPIVILDEATSFTDPENEDNIQDALSGLIAGKTVIIIAHRLSTIVEADNIILLDRGEICAMGRHETLLEHSPLYQKLWRAHRKSMDWGISVQKGSRTNA